MSNRDSPKLLYYLDFYNNQSQIDFALQKISQLRNYHHWPSRLYPTFKICGEIAKALNATLIAKMNNSHILSSTSKHPTLMPLLDTIDAVVKTPQYYSEFYHSKPNIDNTVEFPNFIVRYTYRFNFAYCDIPMDLQESFWSFKIFAISFDTWTWILLILSFIAVSLFLSKSSRKIPFLSMLPVLSALLSPVTGLSGEQRRFGHSPLFIIWMLSSMIITTYYTGIISSLIILAPDENIINDIPTLWRKRYQLVYSSQGSLEFVKSLALASNLTPLIEMTHRAEVQPEPENFKRLAFGDKTAVVFLWTSVFNMAVAAKDLILERRAKLKLKKKEIRKGRKCYVGKNIWYDSRTSFFGIIPPRVEETSKVLQNLWAAGIYQFWMKEYEGLSISKRVQDRVRFHSRTKILLNDDISSESDRSIESLQIEGKILKIFILWGIALTFCTTVFLIEILSFSRNTCVDIIM